MTDKAGEDVQVDDAQAQTQEQEQEQEGGRRVSSRVAALMARNAERQEQVRKLQEVPKPTKKRPAETATKAKAKPSKKAKMEEEDELEDDIDEEPALDAIDIGDQLPTVTLKNEKGEDVEIGKLADEQGVVLFLIPKADTPGCTRQACGFRDSYEDIKKLHYAVYCVSADSPTVQAKWQSKKTLPYSLISDPKRLLITALGCGEGGKTKRSHFIFEKGGKMVSKKSPVKPDDSPALALKFIQGEE